WTSTELYSGYRCASITYSLAIALGHICLGQQAMICDCLVAAVRLFDAPAGISQRGTEPCHYGFLNMD
ncbi:MAG TPA: hypothetical protein DHV35_04745, partial [Halieaceae bacterium]|nr:hypothetical protein [Halieaceae bacterium]